jgi:hypothetical protein
MPVAGPSYRLLVVTSIRVRDTVALQLTGRLGGRSGWPRASGWPQLPGHHHGHGVTVTVKLAAGHCTVSEPERHRTTWAFPQLERRRRGRRRHGGPTRSPRGARGPLALPGPGIMIMIQVGRCLDYYPIHQLF